jgi:hypothetical protein
MNAYKALVREPEVKNAIGRPKCKLEDNVKIYLTEIGSWRVTISYDSG